MRDGKEWRPVSPYSPSPSRRDSPPSVKRRRSLRTHSVIEREHFVPSELVFLRRASGTARSTDTPTASVTTASAPHRSTGSTPPSSAELRSISSRGPAVPLPPTGYDSPPDPPFHAAPPTIKASVLEVLREAFYRGGPEHGAMTTEAVHGRVNSRRDGSSKLSRRSILDSMKKMARGSSGSLERVKPSTYRLSKRERERLSREGRRWERGVRGGGEEGGRGGGEEGGEEEEDGWGIEMRPEETPGSSSRDPARGDRDDPLFCTFPFSTPYSTPPPHASQEGDSPLPIGARDFPPRKRRPFTQSPAESSASLPMMISEYPNTPASVAVPAMEDEEESPRDHVSSTEPAAEEGAALVQNPPAPVNGTPQLHIEHDHHQQPHRGQTSLGQLSPEDTDRIRRMATDVDALREQMARVEADVLAINRKIDQELPNALETVCGALERIERAVGASSFRLGLMREARQLFDPDISSDDML